MHLHITIKCYRVLYKLQVYNLNVLYSSMLFSDAHLYMASVQAGMDRADFKSVAPSICN